MIPRLINILLFILFIGCALPSVSVDPPPTRVYDEHGKIKYYIEHSRLEDRIYDKDRKFKGSIPKED